MKYLLQLFVLILISVSFNAHATRWYTVEIIIFANTSNAGVQEELWPEDPGVPDTSNAVSLVSVGAETLPGRPIEFQRLPMKILANSLAAMKRSSRYRVLKAAAWRLPGLPLKSAPPVLIQAGKRYLPDGQITTRAPAVIIDPLFDNSNANALPSVLHELEGRIRISLTRFLDVDTDLLYRSNVSLPDSTGAFVNEFRSFRLTEFRRMKSNTIHYIDHPMFGMVIAIDRYGQASSQ